jgi:hypothetical protein
VHTTSLGRQAQELSWVDMKLPGCQDPSRTGKGERPSVLLPSVVPMRLIEHEFETLGLAVS